MSPTQNDVAIIGAGPAGLMAAEVLAQGRVGVTVYDAMASAGRKLLMAGRGGPNPTPREALPGVLKGHRAASPQLKAGDTRFPPDALRPCSQTVGQPASVVSS